jgi:hypothetical protein
MPTSLAKQLNRETSSFVRIHGMSLLQTFEATDNNDDGDSIDSIVDSVELTKRKLLLRSDSILSLDSHQSDSLVLTKRRMSRSTENSDEKDTVPLQAAEKPDIAEEEASPAPAKANLRRVATPDIPSIRPLTITNSAA